MKRKKIIIYGLVILIILVGTIYYFVNYVNTKEDDSYHWKEDSITISEAKEEQIEEAIWVKVVSGEVISFSNGIFRIKADIYNESTDVRLDLNNVKIEKTLGSYENDKLIVNENMEVEFSEIEIGNNISIILKDMVDLQKVKGNVLEVESVTINPYSSEELF